MRYLRCILVCLMLACGDDAAPPPAVSASAPTPAPAVSPPPAAPTEPAAPAPPAAPAAPVEPSAPVAAAPAVPGSVEPGTNTPPAAPAPPIVTPPEGADPIMGAIEPTPGAVTLGGDVEIGEVRYVLYEVDRERVARAPLDTRDVYGALSDAIDECAATPRDRLDCARRYAPDFALVLAEYTSPTGIGIARIENGVVVARRSLVAAASPSAGTSLATGDLDGDGAPELIVELDVRFETENGALTDGEAPTEASGTIVYLLDRDLSTRFRFASRIESNIDGDFVSCRNDYELRDANADGRLDLHFERSCQDPDATEPPPPSPLDCIGEGATFRCPPVGTFFFDPASRYFAETMEELGTRHRGVGRLFSEVEARARRERVELEE